MITHAYLGGLLPSFLAAGGAFTCDLVAARQIRDSLGGGRRGEGPPLICINICGPERCVTLRQYPITMRTAKWVDNCAQTNRRGDSQANLHSEAAGGKGKSRHDCASKRGKPAV